MKTPETITPLIVEQQPKEITLAGKSYLVSIAQTTRELEEAKVLDDLAFAGYLGISMEELLEISKHGAVILLRDKEGILIGESQVITSSIPQHKPLTADEAYCYGTAIHPQWQNHGIAQILYQAQEEVALNAGKERMTITVRLENAQSLRARFKAGFQIVGYSPNYYDRLENGGARLLIEKQLNGGIEFTPMLGVLISAVSEGKVLLVDTSNIKSAIEVETPLMGVPVKCGDGIDFTAHYLVDQIFGLPKYAGIGLLKPDEYNEGVNQTSLLIVKHI